ncbi:hypothetical protein KQR54_26100 [Mycobacterium gordonae]|uniref:hypothetical protein n=1 Tax=Mycobacterium gordonae TaxID=1778 RepID=UPI00210890EF|nr:hypothetical protein [Mycobacterium gordonae]MCQ4364555.1 hypothetical protein [Mycobacterium gordonae]
MARRVRPAAAAAVEGLRALQVAKFRARLDRLPRVCDVYDFDAERGQLQQRIAALEVGEVVHVQAWELAPELVATAGLRSGFDRSGPSCFRIEDDELVPDRVLPVYD